MRIRSKKRGEDFPVLPWIRICLPMQGTWVLSLVQEESTCLRATKQMPTTIEPVL